MRRFPSAVALGLVLAACATTQVLKVWRDESYRGGPVSDVLVLAVIEEASYRRILEDDLVHLLESAGVAAHASYSVFPEAGMIDRGLATEQIRSLGVDAVLVTRLVDTRTETVYMPGTAYVVGDPFYGGRGWYDYYGGMYTVMQTPGHTTEYSVSTVETMIFHVASEKPIWSAITETSETSVIRAIQSYVKAIAEPLQESGLL